LLRGRVSVLCMVMNVWSMKRDVSPKRDVNQEVGDDAVRFHAAPKMKSK
jgi:hypothetical protein